MACLFQACLWLGITRIPAETITVLNSQTGTTPSRLGYNLGHFMPDSNAADWFRYSGVNAARIFMSVSQMEPSDDIPPVGDGVTSEAGFFARRELLRANAGVSIHMPGADMVMDDAKMSCRSPALSSRHGQYRHQESTDLADRLLA